MRKLAILIPALTLAFAFAGPVAARSHPAAAPIPFGPVEVFADNGVCHTDGDLYIIGSGLSVGIRAIKDSTGAVVAQAFRPTPATNPQIQTLYDGVIAAALPICGPGLEL